MLLVRRNGACIVSFVPLMLLLWAARSTGITTPAGRLVIRADVRSYYWYENCSIDS